MATRPGTSSKKLEGTVIRALRGYTRQDAPLQHDPRGQDRARQHFVALRNPMRISRGKSLAIPRPCPAMTQEGGPDIGSDPPNVRAPASRFALGGRALLKAPWGLSMRQLERDTGFGRNKTRKLVEAAGAVQLPDGKWGLPAGRRRRHQQGASVPRTNVACGFPALRSTGRVPATGRAARSRMNCRRRP